MSDQLFSGACRFCGSNDIKLDSHHPERHYIGCRVCYANGPVRATAEAAVLAYFNADPVAQDNANLRLQCGGMEMTIHELEAKLRERDRFFDALPSTALESAQDQLVLYKADLTDHGASQCDILEATATIETLRRSLEVYP